ncbi:unnamed protein product [Sympodiomycopsis kandeliae]
MAHQGQTIWPPHLEAAQVSSLAAQATDYALAHGLIYRPVGSPPSSTHAHHAPISLLPSPFPRSAFETALSLQPILNELYSRVALDDAFLTRVIGGNVAKVDEFQKQLWEVYQTVKSRGQQPEYHLGLFRSDYLLHGDSSSSSSSFSTSSIRQVEFNTISSSFGPLCAKVGELHRSLINQTDYHGASDLLELSRTPRNTALQLLARGLAEAHQLYVKNRSDTTGETPRILFVVQEKERNAFDQRWLEYELLQTYGIRSVRRTFTSLIKDATVASDSRRKLTVSTEAVPSKPIEVSVVYYRAGYAPTDYTSPEHWELRLKLEFSASIKCPTVALQLAGAKKVQQVLSEPGVTEAFLPKATQEQVAHLKSTWAGLYPLDDASELGRQGLRLAQDPASASSYVMKPQREGGGNNIYRGDIPIALKAMDERDAKRNDGSPKEREGYILMELIQPPTGLGNYLVRPPSNSSAAASSAEVKTVLSGDSSSHHEGLTTSECRLCSDVVSELGIYGFTLFKRRSGQSSSADFDVYTSEPKKGDSEQASVSQAAYLLRTKGRESDEGGVAVGFSVLDSVLLV